MVSTQDVKENIDLLVMILFFSWLVLVTRPYPEVAKQYPMVFIVAGLAVVLIEFIVRVVLPERYARYFRALTEGLASEFDTEELTEEIEGQVDGDDESDGPESTDEEASRPPTMEEILETGGSKLETYYKPVFYTLVTIVGFWILSYFIGFLYAIPIYVFGTFTLLGNRDWKNALLVTIVLVIAVYFLFGELINVPVMDGELL